MLDTQAMKDFESDVGAAYVSDDPSMVASYAWNVGTAGGTPSERLTPFKPAAVLLPRSTEEVQAIVRTCIRHDLSFRPQSTGYLSFSVVKQDRTVSIDLRRMDRIVEIDADNQMAVIEPYVTVGDLTAAAMKIGLMSHCVGAGWTHSPLASATSLFGMGLTGNHTSQNNRNLLAYEWVTPQGEIVRGGSAGKGCGWFAGEGPGPGFRGVIRGFCGAAGALGVFTKIGYKLHPWDGKPEIAHIGAHPNIGMELSDTERVYHCVWDAWDVAIDAVYELMTSKVATFVMRIPADHHGWTLATTNRDYYDQRRTNTLPEMARVENRISWTLMAISGSAAEAAWRDRTIRDIVARSSGRVLTLDNAHEALIARNIVTSSYVSRAMRGGFSGSLTTFGVSDSMALIPRVVERGEELLKPYKKPGGRMTQGDPESFWIWPNEGRHVWAEQIASANSADDMAMADTVAYAVHSFEKNDREPLGSSAFTIGPMGSDLFGPRQGHYERWMRKIKMAFDPKSTAHGDYIEKDPLPMARFYPIARHLLFRSTWLLSRVLLDALKKAGSIPPREAP